MACRLTPAQLEQQTDRVLCTVEGMAQKNLPATSKCNFVDASRMAIRVQLSKFPHQLIRANASHADRLLQLELNLSNQARTNDAAAADAVPLKATLPQAFRLASAPLTDGHFTLSVDGDSIFRNTAEPQEVGGEKKSSWQYMHPFPRPMLRPCIAVEEATLITLASYNLNTSSHSHTTAYLEHSSCCSV